MRARNGFGVAEDAPCGTHVAGVCKGVAVMEEKTEAQIIPVKAYRSTDRLMLAAPMPGLEAEDITIEVTDDGYLVLHGEVRGVLKGQKDLLMDEWTVGGYHRNVALPLGVDAPRATATYGNGVLVIAFPIAEKTRSAIISLQPVGTARGEHVATAGRNLEDVTTDDHRIAKALEQQIEGGAADPHM